MISYQKKTAYLLHFCSTSKEISKRWPDPPRSQWLTTESLFSCPKFLCRCRRRFRAEPRTEQGWGWWWNWCTGHHSGPSPESVLLLSSPHCTASAGRPTRACVLAEPGCSSCRGMRTKPTRARCSHGPLRVLAQQMVEVLALGRGSLSRWQKPDKRAFSGVTRGDTSAHISWRERRRSRVWTGLTRA